MNVKIASQDAVDTFEKEVTQVLNAIGHPEAMVTDQSQVYDFMMFMEGVSDPQIDELNEAVISGVTELMGRPVTGNEYIWKLGQELHQKKSPVVLH